MIGELIGEFIGQVIIEILFHKIISPLLKFIGSLTRWILCFGQTSFKEIFKKDYNTRVGLIMTLLVGFTLIFLLH
jgi:hypothetical protein